MSISTVIRKRVGRKPGGASIRWAIRRRLESLSIQRSVKGRRAFSRDLKKNESGQATIEFVLASIFLFGFILFFLQLSLAFAVGNYIHYATFMAARAYLAGGPNQEDQIARGTAVMNQMLKRGNRDRFGFAAQGVEGPDTWFKAEENYEPSSSWQRGVRYKFRSRVLLVPLAGSPRRGAGGNSGNGPAGRNEVELTSESWLGREPTTSECERNIGRNEHVKIDNGC